MLDIKVRTEIIKEHSAEIGDPAFIIKRRTHQEDFMFRHLFPPIADEFVTARPQTNRMWSPLGIWQQDPGGDERHKIIRQLRHTGAFLTTYT